MSIIPHPNTPQLKVVNTYYESLSTFNFTVLKTLTTDDCRMVTAPESLGVPDMTKAEDLAFLEKLKESLDGKHLEYAIYDVVDGAGKTWVHGKIETLNIEFVYLFTFGKGRHALKIVEVIDFTDSKRYREINPAS